MEYIWQIPDEFPEQLIAEHETPEFDRFALKQGRRLPGDTPRLVFRVSSTAKRLRKYDDVANNALVPLVSTRLAATLTRVCPADVQLLPATIVVRDGQLDDYCVVNAVHLISSIDYNNSRYTVITGTRSPRRFELLKLRPGCLGGCLVAREQDYKPLLIVGEDLRSALIAGGYTGVGLFLPENLD